MKQFLLFIRKEFKHVFRDHKTLLILFGLPIVQIMLFGFALSNEIRQAPTLILDEAHDQASQMLIGKIAASPYFSIQQVLHSREQTEAALRDGKIKIAVLFPPRLYHDLQHGHQAQLQVIADASDPNTASSLSNYVQSMVAEYQHELLSPAQMPYRIVPELRMIYNPELKGAYNYVPGVMALVLMLVCVMMTSISIVREKELGTMEILLVSPFRPLLVILSKAVPYLLISLLNLAVILLLSVYALQLPIHGSLLLLIALSTLYIITALSIGLLISTSTASQQTAMLLSLMGMLLPTMLFAGFMFPIENMPLPLQLVSNLVPAKWYYIIVKSVMLKGLGLSAIWKETLILLLMTLLLLAISLKKFKTRLA